MVSGGQSKFEDALQTAGKTGLPMGTTTYES
jgi:hypothetical protein